MQPARLDFERFARFFTLRSAFCKFRSQRHHSFTFLQPQPAQIVKANLLVRETAPAP